jgi:hypothetical protein
MSLRAYTGPAGVGKTFRLMRGQEEALAKIALNDGQLVLALTFMHGSRRRLDDRLRSVRGLRARFKCLTIDRFAWELCVRWRSVRRELGLPEVAEENYDLTCNIAGALLEREEISTWVARTYPYVILDEAQDLTLERLRIIRALEPHVFMFAAADEFQCLRASLRPNPSIAWISERCPNTADLNVPHRTTVPALLAAARAIRDGQTVVAAAPLVIRAAPGKAPFNQAAAVVANAIAWNGGSDIAVLTPSRSGNFATGLLERVAAGPIGQQQRGPYHIEWEQSDAELFTARTAAIALPDDGAMAATIAALSTPGQHPAIGMCRDWLERQRRLTGALMMPSMVVRQQLEACFRRHRHFSLLSHRRHKAMTVHQAKNREFEGVIVLWPYTVAGDPEQQRRLLYNAVTRAKRWCTIVTQSATILTRPPFSTSSANG